MPESSHRPQTPRTPQTPPTPQAAPAQAPSWLRPGVVVHDPSVTVDRLIVDFAAELSARGFGVGGYARKGAVVIGEAPLSIDLSTGKTFVETPQSAEIHLARAIRDGADLFAIGRFPGCTDAARASKLPVGAGAGRGLPLLTTIAGGAIHHWHQFVRHEGSMIAPNRRALWEWWGAERLYDDLALGVDEVEARRIVCGPRWLMVEGPHGAGLAYLPRHPRDLLPRLPELSKLSLRALAQLSQSWNPLEAALGVAALNAFYNRADLEGASGNGVRGFRGAPGPVVVVGAFPGVDSILQNCAIIETDPRPGEYPVAAMESLLPGCGGAIVNSSALINRGLTRILRLARHRPVALIGPSTPLTPRLHDYGLAVLGGFVARDIDGLAQAVRAGAAPKDFSKFGRYIHLSDKASALSKR
ncbi:uncharacterized protein (DUF4213/DUF364 family) [Rhodoblastus acidophilus]|uniref:Rossmann-like domain-containing protein n=1 Tax=Rhodoblastus acidophilus TaxID=1074 RepID=UPI0022250C0F|nr:DUF364 domain-containing protein [Rhodoblastus acidophilus]MCW2284549.1 uncharacterized protein (DUF4213/DUF364 family) [Rhodoblastus acidophilus]MCW2333502.1 uncharacterized protein (DUF4213/DUF364 family) [Rhodoblastus acidophilus]